MFSKKIFMLLIVSLTLMTMALNFLPQTQKISQDYLDKAFDRAFTSFAIAKGLNALISVAQGTEIAATPAGLGVVFAAGEVLDPINDMVERFSWVMLASTVSIGIQKIILNVVGSVYIQTIVGVFGFFILLSLMQKKYKLFTVSIKVFIFIAVLRFSIPLFALGNEAFYDLFLSPAYSTATQELQKSNQENKEALEGNEDSSSWYSKIQQIFSDSLDTLNVKKQLSDLSESLNDTFNYMLELITIFLVQTIISPLLFLYLLVKLLKVSFRNSFNAISRLTDLEKTFQKKLTKEHYESKY